MAMSKFDQPQVIRKAFDETSGTLKTTLSAGTAVIGTVTSRSAMTAVTPTVTASAYSAGNVVGGLLTFTNMLDTSLSGILHSVRVVCKSVQTTQLKLYIFNANPTGSTFTDKSAPSIAAADFDKLIGRWTLDSPDSGLGTHTVWNLENVGKIVTASASTLYGVLVTVSAMTPTSSSDYSISIATMKD